MGEITSQKRKSEPDYGATFNISSNHISNFSNQTECKLDKPTSPVSNDDALDPNNIVKQVAPKLLQQSIQPNIDVDAVDDDNDNENGKEMLLIRNQSRNLSVGQNEPDFRKYQQELMLKEINVINVVQSII